jgi:membrane-associated phospholipid phosphatase
MRAAAFVHPHRRPHDRLLSHLPALRLLIPRLVAIAALAVAYLFLTLAVSLGWLARPDHDVLVYMSSLWNEQLHPLFQGIALLGGIELTTLLMTGLVVFLLRRGFGADAWVAVAFVAAEVFEIFYKTNLTHPEPPAKVTHADGPSLSLLFENATGVGNSFPSGHMLRAVLVYGLLAFVIRRLAPWPWARALALPVAVVVIVVVAFDRLYLDVHWESDVVGGLLLGAIAMVSATVWLDRPRRAEN